MTAGAGRTPLVQKVISGVRLVRHDLKRTIHGTAALVRYLLTQEHIEVGLGRFATDASLVTPGQPSRYSLRIANVGETVWEGRVVIDITATERDDPQAGRYASFAKRLTVAPCSGLTVVIEYDWLGRAIFVIDGRAAPPDEFRQGETARVAGWWAVHALLIDRQGAHVDQLTIYQGMKG